MKTPLRIAFLYDFPGWAWHHRAKNVARHLRAHIEEVIAIPREEIEAYRDFDYIVSFGPYELSHLAAVPPEKRLIGSSNPFEVRAMDILLHEGKAAAGFVNSLWQYHYSGRQDRVYYLPNGVDTALFRPPAQPPREFTACWVGNPAATNDKGYEIIKEACSLAGIPLLVPEKKEGAWLSHASLRDTIYHQASVYLCLSAFEGTPNPALEALACGLPVITTPVGNLQDVVEEGKNGFLVRECSVDALVQALKEMQKADWNLLSAAARAAVEVDWSWESQAKRYVAMFSDLETTRPRPLNSSGPFSATEEKSWMARFDQFFLKFRHEEKARLVTEWNMGSTRERRLAVPAPTKRSTKPVVGFVAHGPNQLNGPNVWLTRLIPGLVERGWDVQVMEFMTGPGICRLAQHWQQGGARVLPLPMASTEEMMVSLFQTLRQHPVSVFVPNLNIPAYYASAYLREAGIPTVGMLHSDDTFYHEVLDAFAANGNDRYLDAIVTVSQSLADRVSSQQPADSLVQKRLPYGAPKCPSPARFKQPFRLVYVGRLNEPQKRIHETVRALQRATLEIPDVEAMIYGAGPETEAVKRILAEEHPGHRVQFPGAVPPDHLPEILAEAHAFVLLSAYEGLCIALMEAMACGLVPVCTRVKSGHAELIIEGETGLFVDDRGDNFVEQVRRLAEERDFWQRLSENARARITEAFSSEANSEGWDALLRELMAKNIPIKSIPTFRPSDIVLPPRCSTPDGIGKEDNRLNQPVSKNCSPALRVVQVRSQVGNYSETFLDDHARFLSAETTALFGFPLPHQTIETGTILQPDDITAIQRGSDEGAKIEAYTKGLERWLKAVRPEVVLAETSLMGARVWRACQRTGIPLVVHFHGADAFVRDLISQLKEEWAPMFETAAALVVVSHAMEAQLLRLGAPPEKVLLLPYGVDTHLASLADPANSPPTFLAVGRFVPKKAPHHTIRALRYLLEGKPDARLIMAGDGPMLEPCKQLAKEIGCDHAVAFRGAISREEVSRLMTEVRGFVQHSVIAENGDSEGLPLAILEAGARGLPVVATRHAGIPDALRDNVDGVLVAEGDEKAMAQGMFRLLHHPETAGRMGSSFRQRVCEKYDREGSMERLRGLLEGVAAAGKPKPVEIALQKAQATQAPHERMEALRRVLGLDREIHAAYMAYAQCALETNQSRPAVFALREGDRLQPLPETMTAQRRQLENIDPALRSDLETYNRRCGKVPLPQATKPRRILVFTNLLPPQELGGYGRTVWEFCDLLMQRGHEVRILTADVPAFAKPPEPDHERVEKCVSRALQLFGSWENRCAEPIDDIEEIKRRTRHNHRLILDTARAFQPDWCMAGNLDFVGSAILGDLLKNGWPVVHRLGNADPSYLPERTPTTPRYTIAGCSAWLETALQKRDYPLPRFDILHPGSPLEFYYKYFLPDPTPLRLCFVGLVMPYKGTQLLLEALELLHRKNIPFTCEIAGSSTDPEHYDGLRQRAAAAGLYPTVQFTGFQSKAELRALYARSNVLVFPSVFEEPFGKSQTEAMAAGLVAVTSGTGGAREIVEDGVNGLHFTPGSAKDLAAKLETLAQDPALTRRLQAAGQERAFRFTTLASVERIETIAEELIATPIKQ